VALINASIFRQLEVQRSQVVEQERRRTIEYETEMRKR
jgi:hypothetical protein